LGQNLKIRTETRIFWYDQNTSLT